MQAMDHCAAEVANATIAFFERWPICRTYNPHHDLFDTHEMLSDIFVSDMDGSQALRHALADGALIHIAKRANIRVEMVAWTDADDEIVKGFSDTADAVTLCVTKSDMMTAVGKPFHDGVTTLRIVLARLGPLERVDEIASDGMSEQKVAANSKVAQTLATNSALDMVDDMRRGAISNGSAFYGFVHGSRRFRANTWEASQQSVAFVPSGVISVLKPTTVTSLPTIVLGMFENVASDDSDLHHTEDASVTIDDTDETIWSCTCRIRVGDERESRRVEVVRYFPPFALDALPRGFLRIEAVEDWHIHDSRGEVENLAEDDEWRSSSDASSILSACLPAVRDAVRRRTVAAVDVLSTAEANAAVVPIEETPDEPILAPIETSTPTPEPPTTPVSTKASVAMGDAREMIILKVRQQYGDAEANAIASTVKTLDCSTSYTVILDTSNDLQILQGTLPPTVLLHLSKGTRLLSLPLATSTPKDAADASVRLVFMNGNVRVGRVKLDLASFLHCDWIAFYKVRARAARAAPSSRQNSHAPLAERGSVARFAQKIAYARMLMHR